MLLFTSITTALGHSEIFIPFVINDGNSQVR